MNSPETNWSPIALPENLECATCGVALTEPLGWCSNCEKAYCLDCGRLHFCRPSCQASGCHAGLCVRVVRDGRIASTWGLS